MTVRTQEPTSSEVDVDSARVRIAFTDGLAVLTFVGRRPNTFGTETSWQFRKAAECLAERTDVRVVLITAEGRDFSLGGDLADFAGFADVEAGVAQIVENVHAGILALRSISGPIITAAQGVIAGGGIGVFLVGDLRLMSTDARLVPAYSNVGLSPDCGASWFLPREIGHARAAEILLADRTVDAETAVEWGMITRAVPPNDLITEAHSLANDLVRKPHDSLATTARLLRCTKTRLGDHLDSEQREIARLAATPDGREGVRAFLERRSPSFS